MRSYDHKKIEKKWQTSWADAELYKAPDTADGKDNFYLLVEFPYPSGNLHVGHWYAFSVPDILARTLRMQGKNVLFPMGFDAFGLPAENAAIKNKLNPRTWTEQNIAHMIEQLKLMGASFDWSRKVATIDPGYYRWTQWLFLQFFKKGLAYRKETPVNWCPKDKTVLANEQVVGGLCERCDTPVEQRNMLQWNLKITDYADRLIDDLNDLDWPEQIKQSQRNWIGRKEGINISYPIDGTDKTITVFTTRPDTNFGATFITVAPDSAFVKENLSAFPEAQAVAAYCADAAKKTEMERIEGGRSKTGAFTGWYAINHLTKKRMPIYVGDFVLGNFGTGAVVGVPGHDMRDFEFAQAMGLEVIRVVVGRDGDTSPIARKEQVQEEEGTMVNSGFLDGMEIHEATKKIIEHIVEKGWGVRVVNYRLRDWSVSRQRYWGTPIPIIRCESCGDVPVPDDQLPVVLPEIEDFMPSGDGRSPLAKADAWVNVPCPKCGRPAKRETDTLDVFVDSSWYFQRYTDPKNPKEFASREKMNHWMPINLYSGGAEHTTVHLLYSRFWHKAMFDLGLVKDSEPYRMRMNHSIILGPDHQKMSKSRGNVVNPDEVVERLGADTVRMYLAFIGPYNEVASYPWNPDGVVGVRRFLERVWKAHGEYVSKGEPDEALGKLLHRTIKKVGDDNAVLKFNTAISAMMIYLNAVEKAKRITPEQWDVFLKILAPFAPHITDELWHDRGYTTSIHTEPWPAYDEAMLTDDIVTMAVQINGKVRATIEIAADAREESALREAQQNPAVAKYIEKGIKKVIYVPGRILNIIPES